MGLFGEIVVFTGAFAIKRQDAKDMVVKAGCRVANTVSKKVTMLVVGAQDKNKLKEYAKSRKHRKAETLRLKSSRRAIFPTSLMLI